MCIFCSLSVSALCCCSGWDGFFKCTPDTVVVLLVVVQGDVVHWLACALYSACRKGSVPTVGKGVMEGNCVSLTRILRSSKLRSVLYLRNIKERNISIAVLNFYRYVLFPVSSSSFLRWGNGPTCPTSHSTFVSAWISWNGTSRFQQWSSVNLSPSSCTCFKTHKAEIRRDNHAAGNTGGTQTWQRQHNKMTMHETLMCTILIISLHLISVKQTFTSISWSLN